jgi:hypothetical protein
MKEYNNYLFVDVPEGAKDFKVVHWDGINITWELGGNVGFIDISKEVGFGVREIPGTRWDCETVVDFMPEIVGLGSELTEEQWKKVFDSGSSASNTGLFTATQSGLSLTENCLIIKKI